MKRVWILSIVCALIPFSSAWCDGEDKKPEDTAKLRGYSTSPERRAHDIPYSTGRRYYGCGYSGCAGWGGYGYYGGYWNGYRGSDSVGWSRGGSYYGHGGVSSTPYTPPARK